MKPHHPPSSNTTNPISATELRANIYRVLDEVLATGKPQAIRRNGKLLWIQPAQERRLRLQELPRREGLICSPEELIETSWDEAWTGEL